MTTLTPHTLARAREGSYRLLGQLFLDGPTRELLPYLAAISSAAPTVTQLDQAQAAFQHIIGFSLFPHQSLFLDTSGLVGGPESDAVRQVYSANGFGVNSDADHLGRELGYLAFLCAAEADAWEDTLPRVAYQIQQRQHAFLTHHLLRWLPPFCAALSQQGDTLFAAVSATLWELVTEHNAALATPSTPDPLPEPTDLLADAKTGLREIAVYLTTPPFAGLWLGREEITQLGRALDLPRGFGGRQQLLTNLLRAAAQFEQFPALLRALQRLLSDRVAALMGLPHAPAAAPFVTPWHARLVTTQNLIAEIKRQAEQEPSE